MVNTESKIESDHFIMLDAINTVSGNEFDRSYPKVQIVYPSSMNSAVKINSIMDRYGKDIKKNEKQPFTITISVDDEYNATQTR